MSILRHLYTELFYLLIELTVLFAHKALQRSVFCPIFLENFKLLLEIVGSTIKCVKTNAIDSFICVFGKFTTVKPLFGEVFKLISWRAGDDELTKYHPKNKKQPHRH